MRNTFTKSIVEDAALAWLEALGYAVLHGPDISPAGDTLTPALSLPAGEGKIACWRYPHPNPLPEGEGKIAYRRYPHPSPLQRERGRSPIGDTLTPALSQRERGSYTDVVLKGRSITLQLADIKHCN